MFVGIYRAVHPDAQVVHVALVNVNATEQAPKGGEVFEREGYFGGVCDCTPQIMSPSVLTRIERKQWRHVLSNKKSA